MKNLEVVIFPEFVVRAYVSTAVVLLPFVCIMKVCVSNQLLFYQLQPILALLL